MKTLSLFVDKWFITVAVNIDGNVMPLSLPNGEDRIWLYFYEDTANNRVIYGKTYENNYRDKKPHYLGDIFPLIESNEHYFTRYDNRPEEMREIFKVSNIFSHLREAIQEDGAIDTYISFSTDVSDISRLKFIQELEEANFKVVESVARISHLALEESRKHGVFTEDGMYLVLVATNDNMHYALYKFTENLFVRKSESFLPGFGLDVRKRALIESVVENINRTTRFLSTTEEYALEYKRQERFADDWLTQIANRRFGLPVTLSDITFAIAPNNPYPVTIKPIDLDQRTECLVDDIVRNIAEYVRSNNVRSHEIKGIVFIGNTFTNSKFSSAINTRFIVAEDKLIKYSEIELPKVVNVYTQIDCSQFSEATKQFVEDATTQEELIRQIKEEEERQKIAQAEAKKQQEEKDRQQKAEREYANAIENVERYESEHDYERMREWAELALTHLPDNEYAKEKLALAQQLLAEQRANNKQYTTILQRAKTAYNEGRWTNAISQCDIILEELRPESDEAKRIKRESKRQLEIKEKITNFLNRADLFFAQKLYTEALEEVGKILNLDPTNSEAKEIKRKISEIHAKHEDRINALVKQLNEADEKNDFALAIQTCELLIEEDVPNIRNWTSKKERLISKQKELEENKRKKDELKIEINNAHFDEDWVKLKLLCENYLSISQNKEISQFLLKAQKRLAEKEAKEAKEKALATINSLIIDGHFNEAEEEINKFAQNYPSEHSVVKDLRSKLFSFDSGRIVQTATEPTHQQGATHDGGMDDDFFMSSKKQKKQKSASKRTSRTNQKATDFFDSTSENNDTSKTGHKISNNDFNF